jgi:cytidylate kinase
MYSMRSCHSSSSLAYPASAAAHARRRVAEPAAAGTAVDYAVTLREIAERDQRDASRDVAPMVPARDAVLIDSSTQTIEQVVESLAATVRGRSRAT